MNICYFFILWVFDIIYHKNMRVMVILRDLYDWLFLLICNIETLIKSEILQRFLLTVILKYSYTQKNLF